MKTEKLCRKCDDVKPLSEFYFKPSVKRHSQYCIECTSIINKDAYSSEKVKNKPNQYSSEKQKKEVFQLMKNLGWIFMIEPNNKCSWWKPGVKNMNGTWINNNNKE